jgi:hypothetical protein
MIVQIPLSAIPWQEFDIVLNGQNCTISLRQIAESLFCDLTVDGVEIFKGRICEDDSPINLYPSRYFTGTLFFEDTKGAENPQYQGLNSRWILLYDDEQ